MSGDDRLAGVLDALLPGGEGFPPARDLQLAEWLASRAGFSASLDAVLAALPAHLSAAEIPALLRSFEAAQPAAFGQLLVGAYSGYYVHPRVLQVIADRTGYAGRPPQPQGHHLPPFDPALLDTVRGRPRSYRQPP